MGRRTWETGFNYQEVLAWNTSKITFSIKPEKNGNGGSDKLNFSR